METRRMCPHCRAFITTRDRVCPYCEEKVGPRAVERRDLGGLIGGFIPHARFITVMILLINFGLFAASMLDPEVMQAGAKSRLHIFLGHQWWRLVTAGFLHGGVLHILMNSWVLFDLGVQVEEVYGAARYLVIYFVSTVCGFLASCFWSAAPSLGASAGIFGLIGAMIALGMTHRSALGDAIKGMYIRWAIYGLLFGLLPGLMVDNAAHVGGLAAGFGLAYVTGTPKLLSSTPSEVFWRIASYVCLGLTAVSFLQMFLWFSSAGQ